MSQSTVATSFQNTETPVEVIREKLRGTLAQERKCNRALTLMGKRPALGETNDNKHCFWNSKVIAQKAKELKDKALTTKDYSLLQNSLIQTEENINSFLEVDDVLEALTRDLSCADPAIQLLAAGCCCNIALANSEACISLAKTAGPYFIAELDTLNYPLLEVCAWTIGNLSIGSKAAFEIVYAQGCVRPLITLIDNCDESIVASVMYAVKGSIYSGHNIITDSEVTDLVLALISKNYSHDTETVWILALLSSREAAYDEKLFVTIRKLFHRTSIALHNLDASNVELVTSGIRFFGNTVCEPTGMAADIFLDSSADNEMEDFFEKLLCHPRSYVRKETLWFLGNLYTHVQPRIRERVRRLIPLLPTLNGLVSCGQSLERIYS